MTTIVFLLVSFFIRSAALSPASLDVPCPDKSWYARNIWDMVYFDERLFIGCGNSSNAGPSKSEGPVDIWTYRDEDGWQSEFTVDEEQIERFLVLDGVLTIPGHDSRESWQLGNWYTRNTDGTWSKHRNIPKGIHVYDIIDFHGRRFAALGTTGAGTVTISNDSGENWQRLTVPAGGQSEVTGECTNDSQYTITLWSPRIYGFFVVADRLYANTLGLVFEHCINNRWMFDYSPTSTILEWDGTNFVETTFSPYGAISADRIVRPVNYEGETVYIAARSDNDHQWIPVALLTTNENLQVRQLNPPQCTRPQDIDTDDGLLYILCNEPQEEQWKTTIYATCDLETWQQVFTFESPTYARSFAFAPENKVYIGLGADTDASASAQEAVGQVWEGEVLPSTECRS